MGYYSDLSKKLDNKLDYIIRIKQDRNTAQDTLTEIRSLFQLDSDTDLLVFLKNLKSDLDKQQ